MIRYALAVPLLAIALNGVGAESSFQALLKSGDDDAAVFCGTPSMSIAKVNAQGRISWKQRGIGHLPIVKTENLDWIWHYSDSSNIYIAYEATDRTADGSSGGMCKYTKTGLQRLWCTHIPAFNVVAAFSPSGALYVAGIGMAARINRQTGSYIWKVTGLYQKDHAFNAFRVPIESQGKVIFVASSGENGAAIKRLVINRDSGSVHAIETAGAGAGAELSSEFPRLVPGCEQ